MVAPTAPAILAVISGTNVNSAANPAGPGENVVVYATGLGMPANQFRRDIPRLIQPYAGLAPGLAGVNQVNFRVPARLAGGTLPLAIAAGGMTSSSAAVNVGSSGSGSATGQQVSEHLLPDSRIATRQPAVADASTYR
jgi:hypothetical protein